MQHSKAGYDIRPPRHMDHFCKHLAQRLIDNSTCLSTTVPKRKPSKKPTSLKPNRTTTAARFLSTPLLNNPSTSPKDGLGKETSSSKPKTSRSQQPPTERKFKPRLQQSNCPSHASGASAEQHKTQGINTKQQQRNNDIQQERKRRLATKTRLHKNDSDQQDNVHRQRYWYIPCSPYTLPRYSLGTVRWGCAPEGWLFGNKGVLIAFSSITAFFIFLTATCLLLFIRKPFILLGTIPCGQPLYQSRPFCKPAVTKNIIK